MSAKVFFKNVFVVDTDSKRIIDFADSEDKLRKRISLKKKPYPEDAVYISVAKRSPLVSFETDEQIGYNLIDTAIMTAVINGVDLNTAFKRLEDSGFLRVIDIMK